MKKIIKNLFLFFNFDSILRFKNRRSRVLFWHGVDINPDRLIEAESLDLNTFKKQVEYLIKYYEIISIEEFNNRFDESKFTGREIVLTFDDGYKNNLTVIAPYLHSLNLPFTVFISTNHITTGELYPTSLLRLLIFGSNLITLNVSFLEKNFPIDTLENKLSSYKFLSNVLKTYNLMDVRTIYDELLLNIDINDFVSLLNKYDSLLPMNWAEVKELSNLGATIGSHCLDHICCHNNQSQEQIVNQISKSKKIIEQNINKECNYFAFPNGDYNNIAQETVLKAGYKMGFITKNMIINTNNCQRAIIPRVSVPFNYSTFKFIVNK